jgi:endonuclease YncB( thermonuclease family)
MFFFSPKTCFLSISLWGLGLGLFLSLPVQAGEPDKISGIPVVQGSDTLVINGKKITLWGLESLAPDQQCWQNGMAWGCGEEASTALKHYVDGRMVECQVQHIPTDKSPLIAKCYRFKGHDLHDIAAHLIKHGWGMDNADITGGIYAGEENEAKEDQVGVWSSRFQTAKNWKEGVQKFVGEDEEPAAETTTTDPDTSASTMTDEEDQE